MPAKINVTAETEKELSAYKGQATKLLNITGDLVIENDEQYEKANEHLLAVKKYERELTSKKKKITDPLNTAMKEVRSLFKPVEERFSESKTILTRAILTYRSEKEAREAEERAKLEEAVDTGEMTLDDALDAEMAMEKLDKTTHTKKGSVTIRTVKDIDIVDFTKIPDEYYTLDVPRLRRDALGNASAGIPPKEIPGVVIIEKEVI